MPFKSEKQRKHARQAPQDRGALGAEVRGKKAQGKLQDEVTPPPNTLSH